MARRRILTFAHRRPIFAIGLLVIFAFGMALLVVSRAGFIPSESSIPWSEISASLGEALIVASILALLVDPLAQHQLAVEWGRDLYWAIFSPDAPEEFKEALQALAAPTGYVRRCTYDLTFTRTGVPADAAIELEVAVRAEGVVLDRRGYRPVDTVFVFARWDGSPSEYRSWSFRSRYVDGSEFSRHDLEALGALAIQKSGRTVLDQSKISESALVPFGGEYENVRRVVTTRRHADFFPLFQNRVVLEQIFVIRGDAVEDLDVSIVQLGGATLQEDDDSRPDGTTVLRYRTRQVAFPGQACMVEWRPKESRA